LPEGYILGHETSGIVEEAGDQVAGVNPGMKVIIRPTFCGKCADCQAGKTQLCKNNRRSIGVGDLAGAFAEYIKVFPQMLIPVPEGLDSQSAALAETFASAWHGVKCSGSTGGSALVLGGGPIGLAAVQLLRATGFGPLALSEPVKKKRDLARRFGADYVIDPFREDLTIHTQEWTQGLGFGTVLECSGAGENLQMAFDLVARCGSVCIISVIFKPVMIQKPMAINFKEFKLTGSISNTHEENITCLQWMLEGRIQAHPLISDLIPLEHLPRVYQERIHTGKAVKVMLQIGEKF